MGRMGSRGLDLSALPKGCIENVLSLSGPQDTCRLSVVSSLFRSAAESDGVWQKHLPPDYRSIISRSTDTSMLTRFSSLKDLHFSLCDNPILIDDAKLMCMPSNDSSIFFMSFEFEELFVGQINWEEMLHALCKEPSDELGYTPAHWLWTSEPECRFGEVAELILAYGLEIRGKISASLLSPATLYSAYLVFQLTTETYGFFDQSLEVSMGLAGAESPTRSVYLGTGSQLRMLQSLEERGSIKVMSHMFRMRYPYPRVRKDGWFEIELGEFYNNKGEEGEIEMSVFGRNKFNVKSELIVQGIEIRPRGVEWRGNWVVELLG